ncbi:UPF0236 family transposase-like protein [Geobacillus icigianus]
MRTRQNVFATLLASLLEEIDQQLAEARDKRRYQLKDKRPTTLQTLFGDVTFRWNYYYDRQAGAYTFLLDAELGFDGAQSIRPCLEETAVGLLGVFRKAGVLSVGSVPCGAGASSVSVRPPALAGGAEEAGEARRGGASRGAKQCHRYVRGRSQRRVVGRNDPPDRVDAGMHPGRSGVAVGASGWFMNVKNGYKNHI